MASLPELFKETGQMLVNAKVRPFDRFLLGPFMIWYGLQSKKMGRWPRRVMIAGGMYQLLYAMKEYKSLMSAVKEGPSTVLNLIQNEEPKELEL